MSYEIEEVRDVDPVWTEILELVEGLHDYHVPFGEPPLIDGWQRRFRAQLAGPEERLTLLGRVDGSVAGILNSRIQRTSGIYDEAYGFIENAFIKEQHRGSGLAQAMLQRTEEWCLARGIGLLRLSVNAQNAVAVRFWQKTGFEPLLLTLSKSIHEAPS